MNDNGPIQLFRDCEAVQIPAGQVSLLPAGTEVFITQALGGSYTVQALGGLYRIAAKDADALGCEPEPKTKPVPEGETARGDSEPALNESAVWEVLRTCYDPEIPVNIVDLGLIYDLHIESASPGKSQVAVKMTLTAPGCGMGTVIAAEAQQKLLELPGVENASVDIVWDPPWHHSMISAAGRSKLGLD